MGRSSLDMIAACHYTGPSALMAVENEDELATNFATQLLGVFCPTFATESDASLSFAAERVALHVCGQSYHFGAWDKAIFRTHRDFETEAYEKQPKRLFGSDATQRIILRVELNRALQSANKYLQNHMEQLNIAVVTSLTSSGGGVLLFAQWLSVDDAVRGDGSLIVAAEVAKLVGKSGASYESALTYMLLQEIDVACRSPVDGKPIEMIAHPGVDWPAVDRVLLNHAITTELKKQNAKTTISKSLSTVGRNPRLADSPFPPLIDNSPRPIVPGADQHTQQQIVCSDIMTNVGKLNLSQYAFDLMSQSVLKAIESTPGVVTSLDMHVVHTPYRREIGGSVCVVAWARPKQILV